MLRPRVFLKSGGGREEVGEESCLWGQVCAKRSLPAAFPVSYLIAKHDWGSVKMQGLYVNLKSEGSDGLASCNDSHKMTRV